MRPHMPPIDRPDSLAQQAYRSIRQAIRDQTLTQERFYSESELAESMGISRTPVREALIELAREGIVEVIPQRGFRLKVLGPDDEREVFDLRTVLETYVVRRLATEGTPDDLAPLQELLEQQEEVADDMLAFLSFDEEFHLLMPALVGLERTHKMLTTLRGAMWLMGSAALALPSRLPAVLEEHREILKAIAAKDPDRAEAAVRHHIDQTARAVRSSRSSRSNRPSSQRLS